MKFEDIDLSIASGEELYNYGDIFLNEGIAEDAIKCYKLAAEKGFSVALIQLAELYEIGWKGIAIDFDESIKWYKLAAKNGDNEALLYLIEKYYDDDDEEFPELCKLAAENGSVDAQKYLGDMYQYGNGVEKNLDQFLKWYKLAAEGGNRDAIYTVGHLYYYGEGVEQSYEEAFYWFDKDGFRELPYYICADMYFYVTKDYSNAFRLYHDALKQGVEIAAYKIGEMYYYGLGTEQDYGKAFEFLKYYEDEFDENDFDFAPPEVYKMLGEMYKNGRGVERNLEEAEKLFKAFEKAKIAN